MNVLLICQMGPTEEDSYNNQSLQMAPFPQSNIAQNPNDANVNMNAPNAGWQNNEANVNTNAPNAGWQNNEAIVNTNAPNAGWQNNPCSGLMAFAVNFPASIFGSGIGNAAQPVSFNVTIQPGALNNQQSASNAQQI